MTTESIQNYRKSPRAKWLHYNGGTFFVTVCIDDRRHLLGHIDNDKLTLTDIGRFLTNELENPHIHHPEIEILNYVVMPNHFHAIIKCSDITEEEFVYPYEQRNPNFSQRGNPDMARHVPTLSRYMGSLKAAVSKYAHIIDPSFRWQKRYHDHLIRGSFDGNGISEYIDNNIANWRKDCFYE